MKRANQSKKICPIEKTISHDFILDMKRVIYSRCQRFQNVQITLLEMNQI